MLFIIDWIREGLISLVESTSEELVREEFKELIEKNEVEVLPVAYAQEVKMKTIVKCCCCGKPAVDDKGKSKKAPICWNCIKHGGSVERKCSKHNTGKGSVV